MSYVWPDDVRFQKFLQIPKIEKLKKSNLFAYDWVDVVYWVFQYRGSCFAVHGDWSPGLVDEIFWNTEAAEAAANLRQNIIPCYYLVSKRNLLAWGTWGWIAIFYLLTILFLAILNLTLPYIFFHGIFICACITFN